MKTGQLGEKPEASAVLDADFEVQLNSARLCFASLDKTTSLSLSYPPGHPIIVSSAENTKRVFDEYFETSDRLTVLLQSHSCQLAGTQDTVWETTEARDYIWMMSRDGIVFLHFLAGITGKEIQAFIGVLNTLIDERDLTRDAASVLFEKSFKHISFDAIDESMAVLADVEFDIRDRDTREEREMVENLFDKAFEKDMVDDTDIPNISFDSEFQIRMNKRSSYQQRIIMGSRQFLALSDEAQKHITELKRGFSEHAELEYREGEMLAAILGAQPKEALRGASILQLGEVVSTLLETSSPWSVLELLKIIHDWRRNFQPETVSQLKLEVSSRFDEQRLAILLNTVATGDVKSRRSILRMFHALNLEQAIAPLTDMLSWKLSEDVQKDITRYVDERSKQNISFLEKAFLEADDDKVKPYIDLLKARLPESRPIFVTYLKRSNPISTQRLVLDAMVGQWKSSEIDTILLRLFKGDDSQSRRYALLALAELAPEDIPVLLTPLFEPSIAKRPREEVRDLASVFIQLGGPSAVTKIKALIQLRGRMFPEAEVNLAVDLATMLARTSTPQIISVLSKIGKDWRVPQKIRKICKELSQLVGPG